MARIFLPFILIISVFHAFAQENDKANELTKTHLNSLNVSGGRASSSAGSVTYSIGVVLFSEIQSSTNLISQGIQQPKKKKSLDVTPTILAEAYAYPNPATNYTIIDIPNFENEMAQYHLFDLGGNLLESGAIQQTSTKLTLDNLSAGTYLLRIDVSNALQKTLKIIKR